MNIVTFSGEEIDPLAPVVDRIHIEDIAHSLANSCRFTGHTREFYSVAQHSVLCSRNVSAPNMFTALLHDASEAYLSDIARPIKHDPDFGGFYHAFEQQLERVIGERFGLIWPYPDEIHEIDTVLLRTEQRDLMPASYDYAPYIAAGGRVLERTVTPWEPALAEQLFLSRFYELSSVPAPAMR